MRCVLSESARFEDVHALLLRCGLVLEGRVPQVFPARDEPAIAIWRSPDARTEITFRYWVDPDRRAVDLEGDDAADLADVLAGSVGVDDVDQLLAELAEDDASVARRAAFRVASSQSPRAAAALLRSVEHRDEYVATAALRALEWLGDPTVASALRAFASDPERAPVLRALAREIASTLATGPHSI